jgi:hypothetical protein
MALASCPRCKRLFQKVRASVCLHCAPIEELDYDCVRRHLQQHEDDTAEQVAEATGVALNCIMRLASDGRIQFTAPGDAIKCGRCGAPAISATKRLCKSCLGKLNSEIAAQQTKMNLPKPKPVRSRSLTASAAQRQGSGGVKYNR